MFIIELTYKVALTEVEPFMAEHMAFLEKYYGQGKFLASGRKVPRDGGLIFCKASSKAEVEALMEEDPFVYQDLAAVRVIEFVASRAEARMTALLEA
ncbi:YciI family protein [Nibribacter koreensis]|uniref:YciI family protein n=1 Tax=Nibribacter koreensis TaxID=1084519 RepID=A0ABP8FL61_9BACT